MRKGTFLVLIILGLVLSSTISNAGFQKKSVNFLREKYGEKNAKVEQQCRRCHEQLYAEALAKKDRHLPFLNWYCTDCHDDNKKHEQNPGKNKMGLRIKKEQLCSSCHRNLGEIMSRNQHEPWQRGLCTDCHQPHAGNQPRLLITDQKTLCATCHRLTSVLKGLPDQHAPFTQGDCVACHSPHASDFRGMTRLDTGFLCSTCHITHLQDLTKPYKHGPFATRDCTYCHNPHAAGGQSLLSKPVPSACFQCHPGIQSELAKPVRHGPAATGLCKSCHQPHASFFPGLLPQGGCTGCHFELQPLYGAASKHPVNDIDFSCTSCHQSHGSKNNYLLEQKGNGVCAGCHRDIVQSTGSGKHNSVRGAKPKGDCLNCHSVHFSDFKPLISVSRQKICSQCHDETLMENLNVSHGKAITERKAACADCHDPHGKGGYNSLLKARGNDLCLLCHKEIFKGMK